MKTRNKRRMFVSTGSQKTTAYGYSIYHAYHIQREFFLEQPGSSSKTEWAFSFKEIYSIFKEGRQNFFRPQISCHSLSQSDRSCLAFSCPFNEWTRVFYRDILAVTRSHCDSILAFDRVVCVDSAWAMSEELWSWRKMHPLAYIEGGAGEQLSLLTKFLPIKTTQKC